MGIKERSIKAVGQASIHKALSYAKKDPQANIQKMVKEGEKLNSIGLFPKENFQRILDGAGDPDNVFMKMAVRWLNELDLGELEHLITTIGIDFTYLGTKEARENREKYKCNIPSLILMDPTSACNLHCKGCWAAEYGYKQSLTLDEMRSVVKQGKELGTHLYMFTGGEPLIRRNDIIVLCRENPDCVFLAFTNATLVDQKLCDDMLEVGNFVLFPSIEGTEESNDFRRGEGSYKHTMDAMALLKKNKLFFGISVCYTRKNIDAVTSDEFINKMIENGVRFGMYFNYMPVGHGADKDLIPTPEQRKYMYYWLKSIRAAHTGKPILLFDFQDDGPFVGGCIAGGRNYFHINSAGDMEPCVFIHYSDSNIRQKTLLEGLKSPLFMAYYHGQPFNDNHLRPCPMLENPEKLREIVHTTGAKSTDLLDPEDVDTLCSRCDDFALSWQGVADDIWKSNKQPHPHTMYYRDTPEGKAEAAAKAQADKKDQ